MSTGAIVAIVGASTVLIIGGCWIAFLLGLTIGQNGAAADIAIAEAERAEYQELLIELATMTEAEARQLGERLRADDEIAAIIEARTGLPVRGNGSDPVGPGFRASSRTRRPGAGQ